MLYNRVGRETCAKKIRTGSPEDTYIEFENPGIPTDCKKMNAALLRQVSGSTER